MNKIVTYWSGTGNTLEIAKKIAADLGCEAFSVSEVTPKDVLSNDLIVFGCPAMGAEVLEEDEFRPFYDSVMASIGNKKVALFGSYGWGDGEWMRNWEAEVGTNLLTKGLIVNGGVSEIDEEAYKVFIEELKK